MRYDPAVLRQQIVAALPPGLVVSEHTENAHFYRVNNEEIGNPLYPSVTAKLQMLKDDGLTNWKMGRALDYIFANFKNFTDENIMEHIAAAEKAPADLFHQAGDVGTTIHDHRETIFKKWIADGVRPVDFPSFYTDPMQDVRVISALAALETFCIEHHYIPVITEMKVYSQKWKVAGTLDDLGLMRKVVRAPNKECDHDGDPIRVPNRNFDRCPRCDGKWKWQFVLMDLKTSNRFKDSYFFQVAMYYDMFRVLTGLTPDRCLILKVSKEDRSYKIEDLEMPKAIARMAKHVFMTNDGLDLIKSIRKDNQRNVATI